MRADRLVALLLLLQRKGKVTASEVAEELEISERTARRDLEALGMAGLPIYSTQGRNGGWELAGGGRTDLSGLTEAEVRTLFLLAGPSSSATPEIRAALRKLVRALPESFRDTAEAATRSVVVDRAWWGNRGSNTRADPPHLESVQRAVVEGRQAELGYVARDGSETSRVIHPLGLAVKGSIWYLVAGTEKGQRTFRVDRVSSVRMLDVAVVRPEGFDLATAWSSITADLDEMSSPARATALVDPGTLGILRWVFGKRLRIGPHDGSGKVEVELRSNNPRALAGEIAGFGGAVFVTGPEEVRNYLIEIAHELSEAYALTR